MRGIQKTCSSISLDSVFHNIGTLRCMINFRHIITCVIKHGIRKEKTKLLLCHDQNYCNNEIKVYIILVSTPPV